MENTLIEDLVKELRLMSKRMNRITMMFLSLSEEDESFVAKAEEVEISSNIISDWAKEIESKVADNS